ncbi:uncharacterized protein [Watersipora subatra]|uniref:uncharacterized protein isoform X2 n=1 Tax=Watersipora subatra TaxID=2589382 RepID=UPI00355C342F
MANYDRYLDACLKEQATKRPAADYQGYLKTCIAEQESKRSKDNTGYSDYLATVQQELGKATENAHMDSVNIESATSHTCIDIEATQKALSSSHSLKNKQDSCEYLHRPAGRQVEMPRF